MECTEANMLTVLTGLVMLSCAVKRSRLRTLPSFLMIMGSWPRKGMHLNSSSAWYSECESMSPVHLATMMVIMISSSWLLVG